MLQHAAAQQIVFGDRWCLDRTPTPQRESDGSSDRRALSHNRRALAPNRRALAHNRLEWGTDGRLQLFVFVLLWTARGVLCGGAVLLYAWRFVPGVVMPPLWARVSWNDVLVTGRVADWRGCGPVSCIVCLAAETIPLWVLQGSRVLVIVPAVPVTRKKEARCRLGTVFSVGPVQPATCHRKAPMVPLTRLLLC